MMKERVSLTTMSVTYPMDDDNDLPFESANDLTVTWHYVLDPEYDRIPEPDPWESHDWTNDYDYPDDYVADHDEDFE
jgi:hypothetical protein